jgi:tRNA (guanine-N7-)-methyltransferase
MTMNTSPGHPDATPADQNDTDVTPASAVTDDGANADNGIPAHRRRIRSFVTRAGRLSTGQKRAMDELGEQFVLPFESTPLDWPALFGRDAPRIFEIGFGMGATTAEIAVRRPDDDFVGVEVHAPGVGALLKLIGERELNNIRIIQHDAVEVLEQRIEPASLDGVHIYFPDPWHKARHNKRRLIQPPFVALLASKLKPGGYLHCATDWQPYAEQMLEVLSAESALVNTADDYAPRPDYRPTTKFEQRGINLGHGVWDVLFRRRDV